MDRVDETAVLLTPDSLNNVDASVQFSLSSVDLTYFLPVSGTTPSSPKDAWLVLHGTALPLTASQGSNAGSSEDYQQTLASSDFKLDLPGGTIMVAQLTGQGGPNDEAGAVGGWGLFGGDYYWQVPASFRSGTIKLDLPASVTAHAGYYGDNWGAVFFAEP